MARLPSPRVLTASLALLLPLLGCAWWSASTATPGFRLDCEMTPERPCRVLEAVHEGELLPLEPSAVVWSARFEQAIFVNDNGILLKERGAGHYAIAAFDPDDPAPRIPITPVLSPEQAAEFSLDDLESMALVGDRVYAMGSLGLHRADPERDGWQRNQFVQMVLSRSGGQLRAESLSNVVDRWPDFRDWLITSSGYRFSGDEIRARAEHEGINVEGICAVGEGHLFIGFRGPEAGAGGSIVLEIRLPDAPDETPSVVSTHIIPPLELEGIPGDAPRTVRDLSGVPGSRSDFYVLLGPQGSEKQVIVLARWNVETGVISKATPLPFGFVAEGVTPLGDGRLLLVDDLEGAILIAHEL